MSTASFAQCQPSMLFTLPWSCLLSQIYLQSCFQYKQQQDGSHASNKLCIIPSYGYYTHRKLTFIIFDDILVFCCTQFLHDLDFSVEAFLDAFVL